MHKQLCGYKVEEKLHMGGPQTKKIEYHWSRRTSALRRYGAMALWRKEGRWIEGGWVGMSERILCLAALQL
jgi:hypothetical protein